MSYFQTPPKESGSRRDSPTPAFWRKAPAGLAPVLSPGPRPQSTGRKGRWLMCQKVNEPHGGDKRACGSKGSWPSPPGPPRGLGTAAAGPKDRQVTQTPSQEPGPQHGEGSSLFYPFLFVSDSKSKMLLRGKYRKHPRNMSVLTWDLSPLLQTQLPHL